VRFELYPGVQGDHWVVVTLTGLHPSGDGLKACDADTKLRVPMHPGSQMCRVTLVMLRSAPRISAACCLVYRTPVAQAEMLRRRGLSYRLALLKTASACWPRWASQSNWRAGCAPLCRYVCDRPRRCGHRHGPKALSAESNIHEGNEIRFVGPSATVTVPGGNQVSPMLST
jgi:hypothetical protein